MVLTISSILENINNWLAALGSVCVFAWRTIKALWVVKIAWCPQQMALGWLRNRLLTCQWSAAHATSRSFSGDHPPAPNLCLVCRERCVYEHLWLLWSFVEWQWGWFERKILFRHQQHQLWAECMLLSSLSWRLVGFADNIQMVKLSWCLSLSLGRRDASSGKGWFSLSLKKRGFAAHLLSAALLEAVDVPRPFRLLAPYLDIRFVEPSSKMSWQDQRWGLSMHYG